MMNAADAAAMRAQDAAYVAAVVKAYPWLAPRTDDYEQFDNYPKRTDKGEQTMRMVAYDMAKKLGIPYEVLFGTSTNRRLAHARQAVFWYCHHKLGHGASAIGRAFKRDHTTILYGVKKHQQRLDSRCRPSS